MAAIYSRFVLNSSPGVAYALSCPTPLSEFRGRLQTQADPRSEGERSARQALGLVDVVVPPEQLRQAVTAYARKLAERPAVTLSAIRRSITEGAGVSFAEGLAIERNWAVRLADTEDFRKGVQAFLEKWQPV